MILVAHHFHLPRILSPGLWHGMMAWFFVWLPHALIDHSLPALIIQGQSHFDVWQFHFFSFFMCSVYRHLRLTRRPWRSSKRWERVGRLWIFEGVISFWVQQIHIESLTSRCKQHPGSHFISSAQCDQKFLFATTARIISAAHNECAESAFERARSLTQYICTFSRDTFALHKHLISSGQSSALSIVWHVIFTLKGTMQNCAPPKEKDRSRSLVLLTFTIPPLKNLSSANQQIRQLISLRTCRSVCTALPPCGILCFWSNGLFGWLPPNIRPFSPLE